MIPFFVVDRPMSLTLVRNYFTIHNEIQIGLTSNAQTTNNFKELFARFPHNFKETRLTPDCDPRYDKTNTHAESCNNSVIKLVDSGIFQTAAERGNYTQIFESYENMQANFGIMIDFLRDKEATIESAKKAIELYSKRV